MMAKLHVITGLCLAFVASGVVCSAPDWWTKMECDKDMKKANFEICHGHPDSIKAFRKSINTIKFDCNQVCDTSVKGPEKKAKPGKYVPVIKKKFNCPNLLTARSFLETQHIPKKCGLNQPASLCELPIDVTKEFLYDGRIAAVSANYSYYQYGFPYQTHTEDEMTMYNRYVEDWIDEGMRKQFREWRLHGIYGLPTVYRIYEHILEYMAKQIKDGLVLVIGTESPITVGAPWLEAILLEMGARHIVTLELEPIVSLHPQITTLTPSDLSDLVKKGNFTSEEEKFDAVFSFSSLQTSGLGRKMEVINPWGDLIAMAQAWCLTKKGGRALVGVPTEKTDKLLFNSAKLYGEIQLSHLFANWKQVSSDDKYRLHKGTPEFDNLQDNKNTAYKPLYILEK